MKIKHSNNTPNFKSNLTNKIILQEKFTNPEKLEQLFAENYGIESRFLNNKTSAIANKYCITIFEELSKKLKFNYFFPPAITQYKKEELINKISAINFCIPDTKEVLLKDYPFVGRSIFFGNNLNLQDTDFITETQYKNKKTSSPHFLASFIHEWIHSLQIDSIYKKYGYGGNCEYLNSIYPQKNTQISGYKILQELQNKKLSKEENTLIYDILGEYSTKPQNQYLEIFSETLTKFICESLKGTKFIKNPLDLIKNTPKEFQAILKKICNFTQ